MPIIWLAQLPITGEQAQLPVFQRQLQLRKPERQPVAMGFQDGFLGTPKTDEGGLHLCCGQRMQPSAFFVVKEAPGQCQGAWTGTVRFKITAYPASRTQHDQKPITAMAPVDVQRRLRGEKEWTIACITGKADFGRRAVQMLGQPVAHVLLGGSTGRAGQKDVEKL